MKFTTSTLLLTLGSASAFLPHHQRPTAFGGVLGTTTTTTTPITPQHPTTTTALAAEIRPATEKSETLRFGWDGTQARGGAVEVAKPARMLEDIRAAGESIPDECEVFNANVEMSGDDLTFEDTIEMIDKWYESQLLQFKNGDIVNQPGENEGSAKLLSYAALSNLDKETTLKLWGQYYREVMADPEGDSHQNIRNFMKYGWDGVPFENGKQLHTV